MKNYLLLLSFWLIHFTAVSQTDSCFNIGFENGDLSGWVGETGACCPITTSTSGIVNGRHTLMSGNGTDPNTTNVVTVVAPGSSYSARLGNEDVNAEAERISYTLDVTPENILFIYKYAVVLEDPGHTYSEQPRFQLRVLDDVGQLIDPICAEYTVVAAANIPGFVSVGDIRYKDWTTVGLDLTPYLGSTIKLEFSTGDCAQGGHFGYAYIDASCGPLEITTNYCSNALDANLIAPDGFEYLWSTGETSQAININNPVNGNTYTCMLTSVTGCQVELSTILEPQDPEANFELNLNCYNNVVFENTSIIPSSVTIDTYEWDFGDGSTFMGLNPTHSYITAGDYTVSLTIYNNNGCTSSVSKNVTVYSPPTASLMYSNPVFCESDTLQAPILTGTSLYQGGVYDSSVGLEIDSATGEINISNSLTGAYIVNYEIPPFEDCPSSIVSTNIEIISYPTASISYSSNNFCKDSVTESPILSGTGNYLGGSFSTSSGLSINPINGTINPSLSDIGVHQIYYTTLPFGVCPPKIFSTSVTIYPLPIFTIEDGYICIDSMGATIQNYQIQVPLNNNTHSFNWYFNNVEILGANSNSLIATEAGNYSVKATHNTTQCTSQLETITVYTVPPFDFTMTFNHENEIGPNLEVHPDESGAYLFQLDNGNLQLSNIFYELDSGIYDVTVYDDKQCHHITKKAIVIDYPKFFTPNGDGYKDYWNLKNINSITGIKVYVFNRYGKLLTSFKPDQIGWDGTHNGFNLPSDDYWFKIEYNNLLDPSNTIVWKKYYGHFSLKR